MSGYKVRQSLGQSRKFFLHVGSGAVSYLESMALACG